MQQPASAPAAQRPRIVWIDCAKGITMLLVILGHCLLVGGGHAVLRGLIFSFHMPLFFILSAVTYRPSQSDQQLAAGVKRAARHLLLPCLLVYGLFWLYYLAPEPQQALTLGYWRFVLYPYLMSSGVAVNFEELWISAVGIPWFFPALFLGRTLFDYMQLKLPRGQLALDCGILALVGVALGQLQALPFSLDVALVAMPFFYVGANWNQAAMGDAPVKKLALSGVVWIGLFLLTFPDFANPTYLDMAGRSYPLFPLCHIAAVAATFFVCECCYLAQKILGERVLLPLRLIGKHSLYLLVVHCMDICWEPLWYIENRQLLSAARRIGIDLALFAVILLAKRLLRRRKKAR